MAQQFLNFIGGRWQPARSGAGFENRNPADHREVIGVWPRSGPDDVEQAVQSARRGFELWRRMPPPLRAL